MAPPCTGTLWRAVTRVGVLLVAATLTLAACADTATQPLSAGVGPHPTLPPPHPSLLPTVNVAPAVGWAAGTLPTGAAGTHVLNFASGLEHPRWLYVLPNGDVLVAETNAPPKPDDGGGVTGWIKGLIMRKAGAGQPSADRITLLRDSRGQGTADVRSVFLSGLHSPFGMVLVGQDLYVADTDALLRFHYAEGDTHITTAGTRIVDLPAGPINHHWTKNVIASPGGDRLYVTVGSNSNVGDRGPEA